MNGLETPFFVKKFVVDSDLYLGRILNRPLIANIKIGLNVSRRS
jgi:hypothetical protein